MRRHPHNGRLFIAIEAQYGAFIRYVAALNAPGILHADDVHHEIVLQIHRAVTKRKVDLANEAHVKQLAKSRAIDVARRELCQARFSGGRTGVDLDAITSDGNRLRPVRERPTCPECGGESFRTMTYLVGRRATGWVPHGRATCRRCGRIVIRELPAAY